MHLVLIQVRVGISGKAPHRLVGSRIRFVSVPCQLGTGSQRDFFPAGQRIRHLLHIRRGKARRAEAAEQPGLIAGKAGRPAGVHGIQGGVSVLLHIAVAGDGVAAAKGQGGGLPGRRDCYSQLRRVKAVVLPGLRVQLPLCMEGRKRCDHGIAGALVQMVVRVLRQRPAAVRIVQREGLPVVGVGDAAQVSGRERAQRDGTIRRTGSGFLCGSAAVQGPERQPQHCDHRRKHRKGASFCVHGSLLIGGGAAAPPRHRLRARRQAGRTRTPTPESWPAKLPP